MGLTKKIIILIAFFTIFIQYKGSLVYSCISDNSGISVVFKPEQINYNKIREFCVYPKGSSFDENKLQYETRSSNAFFVTITEENDYQQEIYYIFSLHAKNDSIPLQNDYNYKEIINEELKLLLKNKLINISASDVSSIVNLADIGKVIYFVLKGCSEIDFSPDPNSEYPFSHDTQSISDTNHWGWAYSNASVRIIKPTGCLEIQPTDSLCDDGQNAGPFAILNLQ